MSLTVPASVTPTTHVPSGGQDASKLVTQSGSSRAAPPAPPVPGRPPGPPSEPPPGSAPPLPPPPVVPPALPPVPAPGSTSEPPVQASVSTAYRAALGIGIARV